MAQHKELGSVIAAGRKRAGVKKQADLADKLGCSQQLVSRWEAGLSRPQPEQLAALAPLIGVKEASLRRIAGYDAPAEELPATVTVTFDQNLPIDALSPEAFERFIFELLHHLYPDAREIRRAGTRGNNQGGIDLLVILRDGTRHTFQCKRVTRFGPAEVEKAVAAHTEPTDRPHLVLSRVASPQTAAALRAHAGWVLWDKEDISRLVRTDLAVPDRVRLVDMFFPGQRFALLGVNAPGPWLRADEFFAPFSGRQATFSHDWDLIGRQQDADAIADLVVAGTNRAVLLTAEGGAGKSRMLKRVAEIIGERAPNLTVLFLSPTEVVTAAALDGLQGAATVLIVDDAHDRSDLSALFAFAADRRREVHLLVATRPYAKARLRGQAGAIAFANAIDEYSLQQLDLKQTTELAALVLREFQGAEALAEPIAQATVGCPLVTVLAARIAATENLSPLQAQDQPQFRDTILGKFEKVITGEIGGAANQKRVSDILQVISLVQPFSADDPSFRSLVTSVTGIDDDIVSTTLRQLVEGGVVFKRGAQYRLMPDLLGDYIIEQSCIGPDDRLTSLADRVFEAAPRGLRGNVLVNLGRLDWRRNSKDISKSHLLDHLWHALKVTSDYHDSALEAAEAAAFYQPRRALDFVRQQFRDDNVGDGLARILRNVAYHLDFVEEACAMLWKLGRADARELNRFPNHAIRMLKELCEVHPDKPIEYNRKVVEFGLSLLSDRRAFERAFTPFDFLEGILSGEGHTTESDNFSISMTPFVVNYDAVEDLRAQVIAAAIDVLQGDGRPAVIAAKFMQSVLRYPMPIMSVRISDKTMEQYTAEFLGTLAMLRDLVVTGRLDPLVMIGMAEAVSWHAHYAGRETAAAANDILDALPTTLEFRVLSALADGYGRVFMGKFEPNAWQAELNKWIGGIAADLSRANPSAEDLYRYLEGALEQVAQAGLAQEGSTNSLVYEVLRTRPDLCQYMVEHAMGENEARLTTYLGNALFHYLVADRKAGRVWARRLLDSGNSRLQVGVAQAFNTPPLVDGALAKEDFDILVRVLGSSDRRVVFNAIGVLYLLTRQAPRLAVDMLRHVNFRADDDIADRVLMVFHGSDAATLFGSMNEDDAGFLLSQLKPMAELRGHWVETLLAYLSFHYPERTCQFFMDRVEMAASEETFSVVRPINYGPYSHVPLRFKESGRYRAALDSVWEWLVGHEIGNWRFEYGASSLFDAMFLPLDASGLEFLRGKVRRGAKQDLWWAAGVLAHAEPDFVFTHQGFVVEFLDACDHTGSMVVRKAIDSLFRSVTGGVRRGTPGEPFPRDVQMVDRANAVLKTLSRLSPAYQLYQMIRDNAERDVERSKREAEFLRDG
ncbi:MAG TPA: helix-turn-helix domain-containing protein [Rhizomicrobium sp.]|nr:helix-turn-helix domain-containing protein [Rhizomicrobium sp.]